MAGILPRIGIPFLPSGDLQKDVDTNPDDDFGLLVLEATIIIENIEKYPEIETLEDFFNALKVKSKEQNDFLLSEIMREVLIYDEGYEFSKEQTNDILEEQYVVIPARGLYAKFQETDKSYQQVYKIAFLKPAYYTPGKSDGVKVIPFLGQTLEDSKDAIGNGADSPWLISCKTLKSYESLDNLKKFLTLQGTTDPFICGDYIYSLTKGILGQHGDLNSKNVERLLTGGKL